MESQQSKATELLFNEKLERNGENDQPAVNLPVERQEIPTFESICKKWEAEIKSIDESYKNITENDVFQNMLIALMKDKLREDSRLPKAVLFLFNENLERNGENDQPDVNTSFEQQEIPTFESICKQWEAEITLAEESFKNITEDDVFEALMIACDVPLYKPKEGQARFQENERYQSLVRTLKEKGIADAEKLEAFDKLEMFRQFGQVAFPFACFSPTFMRALFSIKSRVLKALKDVKEADPKNFTANSVEKYLLSSSKESGYGSVHLGPNNYFNPSELEDFKTAIETLEFISFEEPPESLVDLILSLECGGDIDPQLKAFYGEKTDISKIICEGENIAGTVFSSGVCPGGGSCSLLVPGGQEEDATKKSKILFPLAVFALSSGVLHKKGKECGKVTWRSGFKANEGFIISKTSVTRNQTTIWNAAPDQRDAPKEPRDMAKWMARYIFTLNAFSERTNTLVVSGEAGLGIYGGNKDWWLRAIVACNTKVVFSIFNPQILGSDEFKRLHSGGYFVKKDL